LAIAIIGLFAAGCGKPKGNVKGKVYYKDKALTGGTVTVWGDKAARSATIQEDGSYQIKAMPEGPAKVTVSTPAVSLASKDQAKQVGSKGDIKVVAGSSASIVPVPPEYGDKDRTKENYTVKAGDQEYDIRLK
jgi:hypothetical protein